jgi:hypothetical protein
MKSFRSFITEMYSFIPRSEEDILNSTLQTKEKVAKLYSLIQLQTNNEMQDPIAIDFTKPNVIKVARKIQYDVDLKKLAAETGLTLNIGNGSRGNSGANNRGLAFEKYLSKDLGLYIMTRSLDAEYKYPKFMKEFVNKYLKYKKDLEIVDEGALNKPRPLVFQSGSVFVGGPMSDVGKTVTDITVHTDKGPMYLSLKMGPTVTFFNSGVSRILTKQEIDQGIIKNPQGLILLNTLGIDSMDFANIFRSYKPGMTRTRSPKRDVDVTNKIDKRKLTQFLASGVGYGYYLIHAANPTRDSISEYFIDRDDVMKFVEPKKVIVQYPGEGGAKRVDIRIDTPKFEFKVNIRNKQGGVYPTHVMCDYKIKH